MSSFLVSMRGHDHRRPSMPITVGLRSLLSPRSALPHEQGRSAASTIIAADRRARENRHFAVLDPAHERSDSIRSSVSRCILLAGVPRQNWSNCIQFGISRQAAALRFESNRCLCLCRKGGCLVGVRPVIKRARCEWPPRPPSQPPRRVLCRAPLTSRYATTLGLVWM